MRQQVVFPTNGLQEHAVGATLRLRAEARPSLHALGQKRSVYWKLPERLLHLHRGRENPPGAVEAPTLHNVLPAASMQEDCEWTYRCFWEKRAVATTAQRLPTRVRCSHLNNRDALICGLSYVE